MSGGEPWWGRGGGGSIGTASVKPCDALTATREVSLVLFGTGSGKCCVRVVLLSRTAPSFSGHCHRVRNIDTKLHRN